MLIFPPHWDLKTRINYLQRKIILNCIAYYILNESPLPDKYYDSLSHQLVDLHKEYGDVSDTEYGYVMYDFDGYTGFDLYNRLNKRDKEYLLGIARIALER